MHRAAVWLLGLSLSTVAAFAAQPTSAEQDNSGLSPRDNKGERPARVYNYQIGTLGMTVSLKLNTNYCEVVDGKLALYALAGLKGEARPPLPDPDAFLLPQASGRVESPGPQAASKVRKPDSNRPPEMLARWQARFVKKLDSCARSGKRLKLNVSGQDYVVACATEANLIVDGQGGQLPMPWSWVSPKDRLDLAKGMITDDDVEALLLAAFFSLEMGKHEQAETFFARAALKDPNSTKTAREQLAPSGG